MASDSDQLSKKKTCTKYNINIIHLYKKNKNEYSTTEVRAVSAIVQKKARIINNDHFL